MASLAIFGALLTGASAQYTGQGADGNPHNWDRTRRCDHSQYSPKCGICEGVGGIPTGDTNDAITLTSCEAAAEQPASEAELVPPVWGASWTAGTYWEVLIGPKLDPFCFSVIPSNESTGDLCYRADYGSQWYDMTKDGAHGLRYDLNSQTTVGNITSTILHVDVNFWVINQFPWYAAGLHQCVCTIVREGGKVGGTPYYPIANNWTKLMSYVGREVIGIEYTGQKRTLDHWAYGPHHVWAHPQNGSMIRMWQPFNGLQIFPDGTNPVAPASEQFADLPPTLCKGGWPNSGGAAFRIHCDDDGYYSPDSKNETEDMKASFANLMEGFDAVLSVKDKHRAASMPRPDYQGETFKDMAATLNQWLVKADTDGTGAKTKKCEDWDVEELQQLQALLSIVADEELDAIYQAASDPRKKRHLDLDAQQAEWTKLNLLTNTTHADFKAIQRDGACHEVVMHWIHHVADDAKELIATAGIVVPLLAESDRHECTDANKDICDVYEEQVTCADCHSKSTY